MFSMREVSVSHELSQRISNPLLLYVNQQEDQPLQIVSLFLFIIRQPIMSGETLMEKCRASDVQIVCLGELFVHVLGVTAPLQDESAPNAFSLAVGLVVSVVSVFSFCQSVSLGAGLPVRPI